MTVYGILNTIKPSIPQEVCLLHWIVKNEATGTEKYHKSVSVQPENIIYFQIVDVLKTSSKPVNNKLPQDADPVLEKPQISVLKSEPLAEVSNSLSNKHENEPSAKPRITLQSVSEKSDFDKSESKEEISESSHENGKEKKSNKRKNKGKNKIKEKIEPKSSTETHSEHTEGESSKTINNGDVNVRLKFDEILLIYLFDR